MSRRDNEVAEQKPRRRRKRAVSVGDVIDFLEYLAPPSLASPPAPYGLQVGSPMLEVRCIVVAPLASFEALSTAASRRHALVITAAPVITSPIHSVRSDEPVGLKLAYLLEHRLNLYTLANSYAAAPGGFDDSLAERLGLVATSTLKPTANEHLYKLAVPVPTEQAERVMKAAAEAGAGRIGNYSHCSFHTRGTGTFIPCEGAKPAIGANGKLEHVDETRIEMVVPQREIQGVIAAVLEAHPYEEVAYDLFVLRNPGLQYGRGRIGELPLQVSLDTIVAQVQDGLGVKSVRCSHRSSYLISTLAVASGMSEGLLWKAMRAGAGAFVTGGIALTDQTVLDGSTTVVVDVGYAASVAPGLQRLVAQLTDTFAGDGVEILYAN